MDKNIRTYLAVFLSLFICYFTFQLMIESKKRQEIVSANAEIKNVKYGLLSIHAWKKEISDILAKKVKEFEITGNNKKELDNSIQKALHQLLNEVEKVLERQKTEGNFFKRTLSSIIQPLVIDINDLRNQIPHFSAIILAELDNDKTREKLRVFIQEKIDDYLYKTVGEEDLSMINFLSKKYECQDMASCSQLIQTKLDQANSSLKLKSYFILSLFILVFFIILVKNRNIKANELAILVFICGVLLIAGISSPMIDIDARIANFSFKLLGEPIIFKDQILFFQSKSIFDVVSILIKTAQLQSILVGFLIFLFSIVFPISKLLASLLLVYKKSFYNNKFIKFFALKSGKWAMADVTVVAVFMAFIGFSGVIDSQLKQLESAKENLEIFTTDNSNFGVGFLLFLAFTLGGLVLATFLEKKIQKELHYSKDAI